jgi:hypothetical protein
MDATKNAVFAAAYVEYLGGCGEPASDQHCDTAYAYAERVTAGFKGAKERALDRRLHEIEAQAKSAEEDG